MKLCVILEPSEEGGITAIVPALPGCISEGDCRADALKNIEEVIRLYLEPVEDDEDFSSNAEIIKDGARSSGFSCRRGCRVMAQSKGEC